MENLNCSSGELFLEYNRRYVRCNLRFETVNCRTMTLFLSTEGVTSDTEMLSTGRFWPISCRDFTVFRVVKFIHWMQWPESYTIQVFPTVETVRHE